MRWLAWGFNQEKHFKDDLSEAEFRELQEDAKILFQYAELQETFRAVLDNYTELEVELLAIAQKFIQLGHHSHNQAMRDRLLLDRRYANLLSVCRTYLNYAERLAKKLGLETEFKAVASGEYDSSVGYRVMEALRNYVQHRGFPLGSITINSRAVGAPDGAVEVCVLPGLSLERLRGDSNVKASVMAEIESHKNGGDLRQWAREYLDGIRRCHEVIVRRVEPRLDAALVRYERTCDRFKDRGAEPGTIVRCEQRDAENKVVHQLAFSPEIVDHITALRLENRSRVTFARQHVTNAVPATPGVGNRRPRRSAEE